MRIIVDELVEAQRFQKAMLYSLTDNKEFDMIGKIKYNV